MSLPRCRYCNNGHDDIDCPTKSRPEGTGDNSMRAPNTSWMCHDCGAAGMVTIDPGAGTYEGIQVLADAHRAAGTGCRGDLGHMRVREVRFVVRAVAEGEQQ